MTITRLALTASLFISCLAACLAQTPTYTIKLKTDVGIGKTVTVEKKETETGSTKILSADGKLMTEFPAKIEEAAYRDTTISRGKNDTWKTVLVYTTARSGDVGKVEKLSYEGRTVIVERKDGVTRFGVVGLPPLKDADLQKLLKKANDKDRISDAEEERLYLADKPVAVGEEWKIDMKKAAKAMAGFEIDEKSSHGTGKLLKVYAKGKAQFGVLEIHLKFGTKTVSGATFDKPFILDETLILDTAIDGSSTARTEEFTGSVKGTGWIIQGKEKLTMVVDLAVKGHKSRSEERDDPNALALAEVKMIGPGDEWTPYTSKEGKFTVNFPGKPEVATDKDAKNKQTLCITLKAEKGLVMYMVTINDLDEKAAADPKLILKAVAESMKERTTESKEIKLGDYPGMHIVHKLEEKNTKMTFHHRIFVIDSHLYQVMVVFADTVKDKVQPDKFLDSFKIDANEKKTKD